MVTDAGYGASLADGAGKQNAAAGVPDPDALTDTETPRLLRRLDESHKGAFGHLLVVAGCQTMPGAAVLATGGCGTVRVRTCDAAFHVACFAGRGGAIPFGDAVGGAGRGF